VLHGPWGEGGPLQRILEARGLRFVGCNAATGELCMDKTRTKVALLAAGLATPPFELLGPDDVRTLAPPLVIKPPCEGSSIDLVICRDDAAADRARRELHLRHPELLLERFVVGMELTVGVIAAADSPGPGGPGGYRALPPIHIVPATEFYDYQAKYERDDTQYLFDMDLPPERLSAIQEAALSAFFALGCRHLSRVDFIVDGEHRAWILEVNTMPGFTTHSLLPMAAARTGLDMAQLVDRLVRAAR
jgi:D-alanine-D-alanine ligase